MRKLSELYELLSSKVTIDNHVKGICSIMNTMLCTDDITSDEWHLLKKDFVNSRPNIFNKFWWSKYYRRKKAYWWFPHGSEKVLLESYIQRVRFIKYLQKKCEYKESKQKIKL